MNFSLNTDDPTIFGNTINDEFKIAKEYFGVDDEQAAQVVSNLYTLHRHTALPWPNTLGPNFKELLKKRSKFA